MISRPWWSLPDANLGLTRSYFDDAYAGTTLRLRIGASLVRFPSFRLREMTYADYLLQSLLGGELVLLRGSLQCVLSFFLSLV